MIHKLQLSPHFYLHEFLHREAEKQLTPDVLENLKQLAQALEVARTRCGNRPIRITSGYRTSAHNKSVGGAPRSQHLYGKAADIVVHGISPKEVQRILQDWHGGMGLYHSFTHLDIGPRRRWNGP